MMPPTFTYAENRNRTLLGNAMLGHQHHCPSLTHGTDNLSPYWGFCLLLDSMPSWPSMARTLSPWYEYIHLQPMCGPTTLMYPQIIISFAHWWMKEADVLRRLPFWVVKVTILDTRSLRWSSHAWMTRGRAISLNSGALMCARVYPSVSASSKDVAPPCPPC